MERRLTVILAADVVGYSRLMGVDETGTLAALKTLQTDFIDGKITEHQGRTVKLTGDGILVEFPSVVNAVACAAELQRGMRDRNAGIPQDRRIEFRIGVNLGDVIVEGKDIFGDGVNVAARLESIAKPGGITISGSVRDHVGNRLDLTFEDLGEQTLKNIERPVRVYSVALSDSSVRDPEDVAPALQEQLDKERPSIAVLPFNNMSGDPEQEYFSDGITEDIITDLSNVSGLFVVARNTAFTYKGKPVKVQQLGQELGVAFILEGSVRKAGARVRVTGQLISSKDGGHVWAKRYDRELTDIFAIQDEITHAIVEQLKVKLLPQEKESIGQTPTDNIEAYTYYLRGRQFLHRHSKTYYQLARRMFAKAVELDPLYARAYAGIADCDSFLFLHYHVDVALDSILATSAKALALEDGLAEAHASRGSRFRSGSDMTRRWRNSNGPSRSTRIRSRLITSAPVPASRRVSSSGQLRFSSVRQKSSRTTIKAWSCCMRYIARLDVIGIKRMPRGEASNEQNVNLRSTLRIRGRPIWALSLCLRLAKRTVPRNGCPEHWQSTLTIFSFSIMSPAPTRSLVT